MVSHLMSGQATRMWRLRRRAVQGNATDLELEEIRRYEAKNPANRPRKWRQRVKAAPAAAGGAPASPGVSAPPPDAAPPPPMPEPERIPPPPPEIPTAVPPEESRAAPPPEAPQESGGQPGGAPSPPDMPPIPGVDAPGAGQGPLGDPGPIAMMAAQMYVGSVAALNEGAKERHAPIVLTDPAIEALGRMFAKEVMAIDSVMTERQLLIATPVALWVQNVAIDWVRAWKAKQQARGQGPIRSERAPAAPPPHANGTAQGAEEPQAGPMEVVVESMQMRGVYE